MITKSGFKYPKPNFSTIQPLNLNTLQQADALSPQYAQNLQRFLTQPRQAFGGQLAIQPSQYTLGGAAGLERSLSGLDDLRTTGAPVDTGNIFDAMQTKLSRDIREYGIPSITESFGVRGGRYGSDIANAIAKTIGDQFGNVGVERAKAGVGAQEAAQGRRLQASQLYGQGSSALANIGSILQALQESNIGRAYQEFLRMNQPQGAEAFGATQSFLGTAPKFPQIVGGPQPAYEPGISWLDVANTVAKIAGSAAAAYGACWIAEALYGVGSPEFYLARKWIFYLWEGPIAKAVRDLYIKNGREVAVLVEQYPEIRELIKPYFDKAVELARKHGEKSGGEIESVSNYSE